MNSLKFLFILPVLLLTLLLSAGCNNGEGSLPPEESVSITLPEPMYDSDTSVEKALLERRSVGSYSEGVLTLKQVGQLLWAAQGITDPRGKRTAPSAGMLYPLEVYVVMWNAEDVVPGVYKYKPDSHSLTKIIDGDRRQALVKATNEQEKVGRGAIAIVITAVYERVKKVYGERGTRYTHLEAGHAAQNIYLQAVSLKLGTTVVGDFDDSSIRQVLNALKEETPLYVMPVGRIDI